MSTLAVALGMTACSGSGESDELLVYNAQHESLTKEWIDAFTKETGIKVTYRQGGDTELGNQLVAEGDASPADVFLTENSPAMAAVEKAGLFADLDSDTLDQVPAQYRPATGKWTGVAARSTVFVYNKTKAAARSAAEVDAGPAAARMERPVGRRAGQGGLPGHRLGAACNSKGEPATAQWLAGMKANAKIYNDNIATMKAVNAGEVDGGIIYHYYWFRDQANTKEGSGNTALHYFKNDDPGAFVSLSGGGVLKSSKKAEQAQQFIKFVTGKAGQEVLEKGTSFEYPVASGVSRESGSAAAGLAAGAQGRPVDAGRAEGDRSDDEGGLVVGGRSRTESSRAPRHRFRGRSRPPVPVRWFRPRSRYWSPPRASRSVTWCGARCRVGLDPRLRTGVPPSGRRAAGQHRRPCRRHRAAVRGDRCRGGLAGGADGPARPGLVASVVRCAACRSGLRQQLRVGRCDPVAARSVGGCA